MEERITYFRSIFTIDDRDVYREIGDDFRVLVTEFRC